MASVYECPLYWQRIRQHIPYYILVDNIHSLLMMLKISIRWFMFMFTIQTQPWILIFIFMMWPFIKENWRVIFTYTNQLVFEKNHNVNPESDIILDINDVCCIIIILNNISFSYLTLDHFCDTDSFMTNLISWCIMEVNEKITLDFREYLIICSVTCAEL